jgi:glycosyltransferase involved in cell wall biosynthesis
LAAAVKIVVLTPFPLHRGEVKGGGERAAKGVCDGFVALGNECTVLRSDTWREPDSGVGCPLRAEYIAHWGTSRIRETRVSPTKTAHLIADADLVISVDRAFASLATRARTVLLLSNLAYANEHTAAEAPWDSVWVPSPYLADELRRNHCTRLIHIVPPVVRCAANGHPPLPGLDRLSARLDGAGIAKQRRLLFPHRADPGKGLNEAIELLALLRRDGDTWHLIISRHPHEGECGEVTLQNARNACHELGVADGVSWIPWLPAWAMPRLYGVGACTLVASRLPESLSLVSLESLVAGVPVVARSIGNIPSLARQFPSIRAVDDVAAAVGARAVRSVAGHLPAPRERSRATRMFSVDAHRSALATAICEVMAT